MFRRVITLTSYLLYRLLFSISTPIYLAVTASFYWIAFQTRTPEPAYFILIIGLFGAMIAFFSTLSFAGRANEAQSYPFILRLESRVEFLASILLASVIYSTIFQLVVTMVVMFRNGSLITLFDLIVVPPLWLSINLLLIVVAMHASDFVTRGWSRIWLFGMLAFLLLFGDGSSGLSKWLTDQLRQLTLEATEPDSLLQRFQENLLVWADFISGDGGVVLGRLFSIVFWPFNAIIDAVLNGGFTRTQAFAPAVLLLYATVLFLLASEFFANKDILLVEE